MDDKNTKLYESEEKILMDAQKVIRSNIYKEHPLYDSFVSLAESFEKILRETKKIVKISDGQQKYLHRIQTDLKNEIEFYKEVVKNS